LFVLAHLKNQGYLFTILDFLSTPKRTMISAFVLLLFINGIRGRQLPTSAKHHTKNPPKKQKSLTYQIHMILKKTKVIL